MSNIVDTESFLPLIGLAPTTEEQELFRNVSVTPAPGPSCKYSFVLPVGWYKQADVPGQNLVLSTARFSALGVFSPTERLAPPVLVSFGVINVSDQGSVTDHFESYCLRESYKVALMQPRRFLSGMVIDGLVTYDSPANGDIMIRLAMLEDGGRLFVLAGMAPSALYAKLARVLSLAMYTFELQWPRGPILPLV